MAAHAAALKVTLKDLPADHLANNLPADGDKVIQFLNYSAEQGLEVKSEEEFMVREKIWEHSDKVITEANKANKKYRVKHNIFSAYTEEERRQHLGEIQLPEHKLSALHPDSQKYGHKIDREDQLQMLAQFRSQCPAGFYRSGWRGSCKPCSKGCTSCNSKWYCSECEEGMLVNQFGECEDAKPDCDLRNSEYWEPSTNTCEKCHEGCKYCADETANCWFCEQRDDGWYDKVGPDCIFNPWNPEPEPVPVEPVTPEEPVPVIPEEPVPAISEEPVPVEPEQPYVCGDKKYLDNQGECQSCGQGCIACADGVGKCTECMSAREFGYYQHSLTDVKNCVFVSEHGESACQEMEYYHSESQQCRLCGANCYVCENETGNCQTCFNSLEADTWYEQNSSQDPQDCSFSEYDGNCSNDWAPFWHKERNYCCACDDGCTLCYTDSSECVECYEDTATNYWRVSEADNKKCDKFYYCEEGCDSCDVKTGQCHQCSSGYEMNPDGWTCSQPASGSCPFKVGPIDGEQQCVEQRYGSNRVVAPYPADADYVDWREKNVVNPIRDQGFCGSCWAFVAIAAMESAYAINYGDLYELSEQHLVSCDDAQWGCDGGVPEWAYQFASEHGNVLRSDYPYEGAMGECKSEGLPRVAYTDLDLPYQGGRLDKEGLKAELRQGPVPVFFGVAGDFYYYMDGIYDGTCAEYGNHGMVAVGFGFENDTEYILVRNSWGADWGEGGYIKIDMDPMEHGWGECFIYERFMTPVMTK